MTSIDNGTDVSLRDVAKLAQDGEFLLGTPGAHPQAAVRRQRTAHLARCGRLVRKELQPLLADHDVELLAVEKRQGAGVAFAPIDLRRHPACHGEHGRTEIDAHHLPGARHALPREPGDDAGSAGDIENAVSGTKLEVVEHRFDPGPEQRAHERLLVDFGEARLGERK
jgi:hypothetical protein